MDCSLSHCLLGPIAIRQLRHPWRQPRRKETLATIITFFLIVSINIVIMIIITILIIISISHYTYTVAFISSLSVTSLLRRRRCGALHQKVAQCFDAHQSCLASSQLSMSDPYLESPL